MSNWENNKVLFVTGVRIAVDEEHGILIAGMLSESPFVEDDDTKSSTSQPVNFALNRQHAEFLRDRLNEFLKGQT